MKPWYKNSTLQMDDPEMEWLQSQDPASCAVWEWLKSDCRKRGEAKVRKLSKQETDTVSRRLGIDSPRFSQISQRLQEIGWVVNGALKGWDKWQIDGRPAAEEALRKQVQYWKKKAGAKGLAEASHDSPKILPDSPQPPPLEERRGDERREDKIKVQSGEKSNPNLVAAAVECDRIFAHYSKLPLEIGHYDRIWFDLLNHRFLPTDVEVYLRWVINENKQREDPKYRTRFHVPKMFSDLQRFAADVQLAKAWFRNIPKPVDPDAPYVPLDANFKTAKQACKGAMDEVLRLNPHLKK